MVERFRDGKWTEPDDIPSMTNSHALVALSDKEIMMCGGDYFPTITMAWTNRQKENILQKND